MSNSNRVLLNPEPSPEGKVIHSNLVNLSNYGATIFGVSYNGTMEVTGGQPVDGEPTPSENTAGYQVVLECGRHGGTTIAKDFINNCGGSSANLFGNDAASTSPDKLNFFFGINLTFTNQSSPVTVFLGQGQNVNGNNWWIGGECLYNDSGNATLTLVDGTQVPVQAGGNVYTFLFGSGW